MRLIAILGAALLAMTYAQEPEPEVDEVIIIENLRTEQGTVMKLIEEDGFLIYIDQDGNKMEPFQVQTDNIIEEDTETDFSEAI